MAVAKRRAPMTPAERALADRVARARAAQPPRDPDGRWHEAIAELARKHGKDMHDLLDTWDERTALRQWDGGYTQHDAERLAFDDLVDIVVPQRRLA